MLFCERYSDPQALLNLEPEELAFFVIDHLNKGTESEKKRNRTQELDSHRFLHQQSTHFEFKGGSRDTNDRVRKAVIEAWIWLEREGFIAPMYTTVPSPQVFITRRGEKIKSKDDFGSFRHTNQLPRSLW